jgi:hypothetical protein
VAGVPQGVLILVDAFEILILFLTSRTILLLNVRAHYTLWVSESPVRAWVGLFGNLMRMIYVGTEVIRVSTSEGDGRERSTLGNKFVVGDGTTAESLPAGRCPRVHLHYEVVTGIREGTSVPEVRLVHCV